MIYVDNNDNKHKKTSRTYFNIILIKYLYSLDEANKAGLAHALARIILNRQRQHNFQLVCITHDEVMILFIVCCLLFIILFFVIRLKFSILVLTSLLFFSILSFSSHLIDFHLCVCVFRISFD